MLFLELILKFLVLLVPLLISVAILTLMERKVMGAMQKRRGPNLVGFFGLLQPIADGLKLALKEIVIPHNANRFFFLLAPTLLFSLSLTFWTTLPFSYRSFFLTFDINIIFILVLSGLSVYGVILSGWSSNSRYPLYGGLRSTAQLVSYEIPHGLIILTICLFSSSLNLIEIVYFQAEVWNIFLFFPGFLMFLITSLAETNRAPFDLPEAEAELVSGYNVEYSSLAFALFFLGEYANILFMSALCVIFFLGGWLPFLWITSPFLSFSIKEVFILFIFIWVRAAFPRYRYDQLMSMCWKTLLPLCFSFFVFFFNLLFFVV
jgi:NADH-quinone oxidoreductase subunit H